MYAKPWNGDHKGTFYGLNDLQLKIVIAFLQEQHPDQLATVQQVRLMEFAHVGHSLVGLYNYLIWALNCQYPESAIIETIDHDLREMHTRLFVARTHEYENMEVNRDWDIHSSTG